MKKQWTKSRKKNLSPRYQKVGDTMVEVHEKKRKLKGRLCACGQRAVDKWRGEYVCRDCMFEDNTPLNMVTWLASIITESNAADPRQPMTHYEVTNNMFGGMVKRRPY